MKGVSIFYYCNLFTLVSNNDDETCVCVSALEPFFNAAASQFILGQSIPITLWLSLAPVVLGNLTS
jgi:hypothetical protein